MINFIIKRILMMIPTLLIISIISFIIIQLPPGDYLTSYIMELQQSGQMVSASEIASLEKKYGLNQPLYVQYFKWISGVLKGDFGYSFQWEQPVSKLIGERLLLTFVISILSLLFSWIVAFPIGVYTALNKNTIGDYFATFIGFIGLSTPNFMLALILMYIGLQHFGWSAGGLFSPEYINAPWSWAKVIDMMKHIWVPLIVIGTSGTASLIRVMRNNLLDELEKPYVVTARAKGLNQTKLIFKYPVRLALTPFVSVAGWQLPYLISGETVTSVVLSLPTTGSLLLRALKAQDMYLAGSFLLCVAALTVIGTLISDICLTLVDPRIKFQ